MLQYFHNVGTAYQAPTKKYNTGKAKFQQKGKNEMKKVRRKFYHSKSIFSEPGTPRIEIIRYLTQKKLEHI